MKEIFYFFKIPLPYIIENGNILEVIEGKIIKTWGSEEVADYEYLENYTLFKLPVSRVYFATFTPRLTLKTVISVNKDRKIIMEREKKKEKITLLKMEHDPSIVLKRDLGHREIRRILPKISVADEWVYTRADTNGED